MGDGVLAANNFEDIEQSNQGCSGSEKGMDEFLEGLLAAMVLAPISLANISRVAWSVNDMRGKGKIHTNIHIESYVPFHG